MNDILVALTALVLGPVVTYLGYMALNALISRIPGRFGRAALPYVFIGPVLALIFLFLVLPTLQTIQFSFMSNDSSKWVGFRNYEKLFDDPEFIDTLINNFLWVAIVPIVTVILGILIATLANNVGPLREKVFKTIIFMPMAISFVAASSVWRLTYSYDPGETQIGLLNAIITSINLDPVEWLQFEEFKINNLLIMVVVVWATTGFAMTLLSAAIKAVPEETIEAAAIDGANSRQVFFRVVLPQIRATAISVLITVLISCMKIFDVIWGMTGGNFHTNVLGVNFMLEYFVFNRTGRASAVVVLLMLAIIPIMIYQVRTYRKQEELR